MKRAYRRRTFLVGALQYRLLAVTALHFVAFTALVAVALFAPLIIDLQGGLELDRQGDVAAQFLYLHRHFWPALGVIFCFVVAHSIVVSHRIAGPLVGFRRVLRAVGGGDLTVSATIRRHDYLKEEASSINGMIAGLSWRMGELRERCGRAATAFDGLRAALEGNGPTAQQLQSLADAMVGIELALQQFNIPRPAAREVLGPRE
jgi:methyl-accepting chemotaxis protein